MTARALGPAVLVDGDSLETLRYAVAVAVRDRRHHGAKAGPLLTELHEAAGRAFLSARRQDDSPTPPHEQPCDQWLTTAQVAQRLGVSHRTAQRLAPKLDGRRIGGHWLVDPDALHEHQTQRKDTP